MLTCEDCRDLIWDELYGLLDASQSQTLRRHLTDCAGCQAEMTRAEAAERLIARVARLDLDIPPFQLPAPETAAAARAADRASLPMPRRFRRPWLAAAAAALLVCVGLSYGVYRHGLSQRAVALQRAEKQVEEIAARQEELVKKSRTELEAVQVAERGKHTRLQISGPATYQPGLLSQYRILATDLNDQPRPLELTARLSAAGKRVLFETKVAGQGELSVMLPGDLPATPRSGADLEFTAVDAAEPLHLQETISVLERHYVTQLVTDKIVYHPGETIYFRSLTLEPFALTPTDKQFSVSYTLMDPRSVRIARVAGLLWPCCAGGGTFVLKPNAEPGPYRLTITDLANRFLPVTRTITVVPGAADQGAPQAMPGQWTKFGLRVQFFPEGGTLVADVPNRVYFRAQDGKGSPVDLAGEVLDSKGNVLVRVETVRTADAMIRGLGVFSYTPVAGESYTLRAVEAAAVATAALPAARADGIALHVPASVVKEGQEIPLVLHGWGKRHLIVAATCRGSLVAEAPVVMGPGTTELTLKPARDTRGVLRLSVFDSRSRELQPIAERFIYCAPAERLDLALETDKKTYRPGDHVTLSIKSSGEKRRPELAWLSVSTGKRDALSQADGLDQPGLPPHLEFDSGLAEPKQIEQAIFMVRDDPQEKPALDLFLATHGWPVTPPPTAAASTGPAINPTKADRESATVGMFALDNLGQVEKTYVDKIQEEAAKADKALAAQISGLGKQRARGDVADAARQLAEYQEQMQVYGRMALGGIAIAALTLACLFLITALVGMARGSAMARRRLATAFVTGIFCPLCLPLSSWLVTDKVPPRVPPGFAANLKPLGQDIAQNLREPTSFKIENPETKIATIAPGDFNLPRERPRTLPVAAPLPLQEFAFNLSQQPAGVKAGPDTLLWVPGLIFNGQTQLSFDLPKEPALYRVRVEGHTSWGQLGIAELPIDTRSSAK